jgi:uroporphyrinogen decarboxylase
MRTPDFDNVRRILDRGVPARPTLFEFFLNWDLYVSLAGPEVAGVPKEKRDDLYASRVQMQGFLNAGYDYVTMMPGGPNHFHFPQPNRHKAQTVSINEGDTITDRQTFEAYPWLDPDQCDYSVFERLAPELPKGAKFIAHGPSGVLENAIGLVGYERLCLMTMMDPDLAQEIFDSIGSRLVRYYAICASFDSVGACISNDDWGFKGQTMLSPDDMRRYVFPWHTRIVEAVHRAGKQAILHSCGNLEAVMDDVIDDMRFDGKHSYEDAIMPVEDAYDRWGRRIAILGGIDVDYLIRHEPDAIRERCAGMLARSAAHGSYGLGSGNSIPSYVPSDHYLAMIHTATNANVRVAYATA